MLRTSQPQWTLVESTDDTRIYADQTGVYAPKMERAEEVFDTHPRQYQVFRFSLDRLTLDPIQLQVFNNRPGFGHHLRLVDCIDDKGVAHAPWFEDDAHADVPGAHTDDQFCVPCGSWVSHHLTSAAACTDQDPDDLRRCFCSEDVKERAWAYETIAGYHGWENFDSYPLTLTGAELNKRWGTTSCEAP